MDGLYFTHLYLLFLEAVCVVCQTTSLFNNITPQYDSEMFAQKIHEKPHFVMFYAPWCGHCQRLKGTFDQLSEKFNKETTESVVTVIAKVDCTKHISLCSQHNIISYPTMLFFWYDEKVKRRYKGRRDFKSLDTFITTMTEEGPSIEPELSRVKPKASRPFDLTEETFAKHLSRGHHFVNFYAPWCGHCKTLGPVWERLRAEFRDDPVVSIVQVDCSVSKSVCVEQNIKGFPSLVFYCHGQMVEEYSGGREFERLVEFVLDLKVRQDQRFAAIENDSTTTDHITVETAEPVILESHESHESGVVSELSPDVFSQSVGVPGLKFVLFYAPWCPHCQSLAPTFQLLAKHFQTDPVLSFSQIDCARYQILCAEQNVRAYPTLALYSAGKQTDAYGGLRTLGAMEVYLLEKRSTYTLVDVSEQQQGQQQQDQQHLEQQQRHLDQQQQHLEQQQGQQQQDQQQQHLEQQQDQQQQHLEQQQQQDQQQHLEQQQQQQDQQQHLEQQQQQQQHQDQQHLEHQQQQDQQQHLEQQQQQHQDQQHLEHQQTVGLEQDVIAGTVTPLTHNTFHLKIQVAFTFINFFQPWCAHCVTLEPVWLELSSRYKQHTVVTLASVNCADEGLLCREYSIDRYPTLVMYREGERWRDYSGARDVDSLSAFVDEVVNLPADTRPTEISKSRDEL